MEVGKNSLGDCSLPPGEMSLHDKDLSLYGTYLLSLEGATYKQIICRYFQGTEITHII